MTRIAKIFMTLIALVTTSVSASAQYYQLANQATDMLSAAIRGGLNYRGLVDVSYINGIGSKQASFVELSTTQGFKYSDMFYMGVGAGIDLMFTEVNNNPYQPTGHGYTKNAAMVPLYTDFRLNLGQPQSVGFFIDLRIGAGFYISGDYILVGDGYINSSESFYLKPSLGFRIPLSSKSSKYAMNIGASYQLLTNSYWYNPGQNNNVTLNGLGITAGFEW